MKKLFILLAISLCSLTFKSYAQCGGTSAQSNYPTSVGIVMYSNDVETLWNALRFANYAKSQGDTVSIFLLGKGVELDNLVKTNPDLQEQTTTFLNSGATILGCGTCLQSRKNDAPQVCKFSSMDALYALIRKNKIVLTF